MLNELEQIIASYIQEKTELYYNLKDTKPGTTDWFYTKYD